MSEELNKVKNNAPEQAAEENARAAKVSEESLDEVTGGVIQGTKLPQEQTPRGSKTVSEYA